MKLLSGTLCCSCMQIIFYFCVISLLITFFFLFALFLDEKLEPLNWELRVQIALDVARGLEYLHDGVSQITSFSCSQIVILYAFAVGPTLIIILLLIVL